MRPSVRAAFVDFSSPFEGVCTWLYLDVKGLVTTGIGNLVDPSMYATSLPFVHPDGTPATPFEIRAEWCLVKSRQDLKLAGGGAFAKITKLRLTKEGVAQVVDRRLKQIDAAMRSRFANYEEWPADAQLGVLSMCWAMGPGFRFPKFDAAARKQDWTACTNECHMDDTGNPGLRPRNAANVRLFQNAARVVAFGLDPEELFYPDDATQTLEKFKNPSTPPAA